MFYTLWGDIEQIGSRHISQRYRRVKTIPAFTGGTTIRERFAEVKSFACAKSDAFVAE
jgi:hypothetical protein